MKEREDAKNAAIDKLTSNLSEKSLALASPGITLYDEYRWKYRKSAKEALIANGNKPTEHDIENLALKSFLNDYLVSQLQDPESAEPSIEGYIDSVRTSDNPFVSLSYGRTIRQFDTTVGMAVGFWDSIKNTGNAIGDYAWSMTSTGSSFVDAVQGNVTWDEFNTVLAQDNETRKSIAIGNYSGILDMAVGAVAGPMAMQEYILYGSSFIQNGINGLTSAKDSGMIDICGLNAEEYMQAKSMATVEVTVITLAASLGAELANSAAAKAVKTEAAQSESASTSTSVGRAKNKLQPDPMATGDHTVFRRDPVTGQITHYVTYEVNPLNPTGFDQVLRYDGVGKAHYNSYTGEDLMPHVHDKSVPGGVREPEPFEIP